MAEPTPSSTPIANQSIAQELASLRQRVAELEQQLLESQESEERSLPVTGWDVDKLMRQAPKLTQFSIEHAVEQVLWILPNAQFFYANKIACQTLGYTSAELSTMKVFDIDVEFPPEAWPNHWQDLKQYGSVSLESRHRAKDGRIYPVEITANYLEFEGHGYNFVQVRDISDRKAAEAKLIAQEQFLRSIYDGVECFIFVITVEEDGNFIYTSYNRSAEKLTGLSSADIAGKTPEDRFGPEDGALLREVLNRCVEMETAITQEEHLPFGDRHIWFMTTFNPIKNEQGRVHQIVGTTVDVTHLKETEAQLTQQTAELEKAFQELQNTQAHMVQAEKMSSLGQLVAGIAHEINNPVNFIYGNLAHANGYVQDLLNLLSLYQTHYPSPHAEILNEIDAIELGFLTVDLPKSLQSMRVGAERIQKIVASLRNFSRMDEAEMKEVNIHEGIDSTLMILQSRLKAKPSYREIKVVKDYGCLPLVECYAGQLNQVFMNLLSNAIDALEEADSQKSKTDWQPTITIRTECHEKGNLITPNACLLDTSVIICIGDNGLGISETIQKRLFDPFFTTKPIGKGTGMGLSISYQIVTEKHGGSLQCHSQPEQGAEFIITIPLRQSNAESD